ncbi:MAG: MBL fold metallo-hydrolase [Spirochaetales bacterium]|nr:MAG: MBL fold metallo-hydrolase [Spirochaetales bacterium]
MISPYDSPVEIAEGVFWIGFYDVSRNLHCNPYLVIDGNEAVLIDGGSRTDFSSVMMKLLQTGIKPSAISHLIYQHYDPDLCSSIPNFEDIIDKDDLNLLSQRENNVFIRYYSVRSRMFCVESIGRELTMKAGRKLRFILTPYAHSAGSFMTFDERTGTLFSSDLFGSYDIKWELFVELTSGCADCEEEEPCPGGKDYCPVKGIKNFHRRIMTSRKALKYAMEQILPLKVERIAPQHGSIIRKKEDIGLLVERLMTLDNVGIDGVC